MHGIPTFVTRRAVALALAVPLAVVGCSKNPPTSATPDCDGTNLLAFTSDRNQTAGQTKIYLYDLDQSGFRAIPGIDGAGTEHSPAIANDRRSMAFVTNRGTATGDDILFYDRCTDRTLEVSDIVTPFSEREPAFSGDSRVLGFVRDTTGSQSRVRLFDGQALKYLGVHALDSLLSVGTTRAGGPALTHTANVVAFAADLGTGWDLYVYDRGADTLRELPDLRSAGDDEDPWITPDGRYLAFASNRAGGAGGYDVYLYDLATRAFVPLENLNSSADDRQPTMSRDANFFVFASTRTDVGAHGGWDLWNYTRSTKTLGQKTEQSSSADDTEPCFAFP
jgi:Tol biopolymer transport system component